MSLKKRKKTSDSEVDCYHHGNLRSEVLQKSLVVIETKGITALSIRDVARSVGVSHVSIYHHFSSKNDLLNQVAEIGFKLLNQIYRPFETLNAEEWKRELLRLGNSYVNFAIKNPAYYKTMYSADRPTPKTSDDMDSEGNKAFGQLLDFVKYGIKTKVIQGRPEQISAHIWSSLHGISELLIAHRLLAVLGDDDVESFIQQHLSALVFGLQHKNDDVSRTDQSSKARKTESFSTRKT